MHKRMLAMGRKLSSGDRDRLLLHTIKEHKIEMLGYKYQGKMPQLNIKKC